jgi:hypothetical protein
MARIAHRAAFLQAFHTATSETTRKANIEAAGSEAYVPEVKEAPKPSTNSVKIATKPVTAPATEPQINYLVNLMIQKRDRNYTREMLPIDLTKIDAMRMISTLKEMPYLPREAAAKAPESNAKAPVTIGGYIYQGRVFNVYKARGGSHLLVREFIDGTWEYVGSVYKLPHDAQRMTLEESQAFGRQYVQCCQCGRTLTNKESKAAGIGPICAGRM